MSENEDIDREIEETTAEGLAMSHDELATAYACAIANWNTAISERDEARDEAQMWQDACGHANAARDGLKTERDAALGKVRVLEGALAGVIEYAEAYGRVANLSDDRPAHGWWVQACATARALLTSDQKETDRE